MNAICTYRIYPNWIYKYKYIRCGSYIITVLPRANSQLTSSFQVYVFDLLHHAIDYSLTSACMTLIMMKLDSWKIILPFLVMFDSVNPCAEADEDLRLHYLPPIVTNPECVQKVTLSMTQVETIDAKSFKDFSELTTGVFFMNKISSIHYRAFSGTKVNFLNLSNNKLASIPRIQLETLEVLNLHYNLISHIGPEAVDIYPKLKSLQLTRNNLKTIAALGFCGPSLEQLYLDSNKLKCVPNLRCLQHSLQLLDVGENMLGDCPSFPQRIFDNFWTVVLSQIGRMWFA